MTLTAIKKTVNVGDVYEVTNHYITREDHPCYGTRRATVEKANPSAFTLSPGGRTEWPKTSQVERDEDGTLRLYGGGIGQKTDELFLTLRPAS